MDIRVSLSCVSSIILLVKGVLVFTVLMFQYGILLIFQKTNVDSMDTDPMFYLSSHICFFSMKMNIFSIIMSIIKAINDVMQLIVYLL